MSCRCKFTILSTTRISNLLPAEETFSEQIQFQFPTSGDASGYCWQQFISDPPNSAPHFVNERFDISSGKPVSYFACGG